MKLIILTSIVFILISCTKENENVKEYNKTTFKFLNYGDDLKVIEIDSCEYLFGPWGNGQVLTHKGNCKYCITRNKLNK